MIKSADVKSGAGADANAGAVSEADAGVETDAGADKRVYNLIQAQVPM